jgi:hypothetical protein
VSCTFEDSKIPGEWQGVLLAQTLWLLGPLLTESPSASQESNTLRELPPYLVSSLMQHQRSSAFGSPELLSGGSSSVVVGES